MDVITIPQTIDAWSAFFERLYGKRNRESRRSAATFLLKVTKRALRLQSPKFPRNLDAFAYEFAFCFAWYCAFMRRFAGKSIAQALICEFPHACPYCTQSECTCTDDRGDRRRKWAFNAGTRLIRETEGACLRVNLQGWADVLGNIYPKDRAASRSIHYCWDKWGEEIGEVIEALEDFDIHKKDPSPAEYKEDLISETMDALCRFATFGARVVADSEEVSVTLDQLVWRVFEHGCPVCRKRECTCGDTAATRKRDQQLRRQLEREPLLFDQASPRVISPRRASATKSEEKREGVEVNVFVHIEQQADRLALEAREDPAAGEAIAKAIEALARAIQGPDVDPDAVEKSIEGALDQVTAEQRPKWRQKLAGLVARLGEAVVSPHVAAKLFEIVARVGSGQSAEP